MDLEKVCDIHAIQVNFADEALSVDYPESLYCHQSGGARYIEKEPQISCYTLEASTDGTTWQLLQEVSREGSNAYFPLPERVRARYVRLTGGALPMGRRCASAVCVFLASAAVLPRHRHRPPYTAPAP